MGLTTSDLTFELAGHVVNRVGLGAKRLLRDDSYTPGDRASAVRLLQRAAELGVNHIDTAAFYPSFASPSGPANDFTSLDIANELIREALAPYPDDLLIATKVGPTAHGLARPDQLTALVEADLRALGRGHRDLVYLRQGGLESVAEHFGVLAELQQAGKTRTSASPACGPSTSPRLRRSRRWWRCRTATPSTSAA